MIAQADFGWTTAIWPILALLIVLGVLYASMRGLQALAQGGAWTNRPNGELLQLRRSIRLGRDQSLHVIQFGKETLLVGAAAQSLSVLARMETPVPSGMETGAEPAEHPSFAEALRRNLRGGDREA
jgi:flagellar biogenesis protein FliO